MAITGLSIANVSPSPILIGPGTDGTVSFSYTSDTTNSTLFDVIASPIGGGPSFVVGSVTADQIGSFSPTVDIDVDSLDYTQNYIFVVQATDQVNAQVFASGLYGPVDIVCFAEGTLIVTERGEVAVENLRASDLVATMHGTPSMQPIQWIGHTRIVLAEHPDRRKVAPILIKAGALSEGAPRRDLRVSPEHAMLIDGFLVPARLLVNGATIVQELWRDHVTYWHVELATHGLLVSEGAVSESYFDDGNRQNFDNFKVAAMVKDFESHRANGRYRANTCAPLIEEGAALIRIRARLAERAEADQSIVQQVA